MKTVIRSNPEVAEHRPESAPRLLHLVGSLPRSVAETEISAMRWILDRLEPASSLSRGDSSAVA